MRAMPSPTEVITPSWASTTGASKLAMRCFRMSPISSLRMAIVLSFLFSDQRHLELLEQGAHAVVDHTVADADDEAAQDGGILAHLSLDLGPQLLAECAADASFQVLVDRDGGGHLGANHST